MRSLVSSKGARLAFGMWVATSLWSADFSFTTGNPDGLMGAVSRRASPGKLETETADDFTLGQTTVIRRATIVGLVPSGTDIKEVEVEVYHVFPLDSAVSPRQCALAGQLALERRNRHSHACRKFWDAYILHKRAEFELRCGQHRGEQS